MNDSNELETLRQAAASGAPDDLHRYAAALVANLRMEEAFEAYSRAAEAGHAGALLEQGRMLMYGVGTTADIARAVQAFEQAEAAGQPIAGYFLALIGLGDTAVPRDARVGERLLAAVQAAYPPALRAAAIHFGRKPNLQDQALAIQLLDHAAGRGDAIAAHLLAERVRRGEGCTAQPEAAAQLKAKLREGGFDDLPEIIAVPAAPKRPSPPSTLALDEVMDPPEAEVLAESPRIAQVDGLLSVDECRLLVATAQPLLRAAAQTPGIGPVPRVAFEPLLEDVALRLVQLRLAAAADMELVEAEPLVVARVAPGDGPVLPEAAEGDDERQRAVYACLAIGKGGARLRFPGGIVIDAEAGRAIVADASGATIEGDGWFATLPLSSRRRRDY
ncbi:hypothetical protein GCM10008101_13440 [Lysobacter xinjiangensis]|uniref:Sel1 repeat family protein n=1 Tax=Cognatilysobacter xinjiangensis TaxID=546892 RepID=A0ABQ3C1I0_9GAMM|nr:sel1 repeat family protein [Lysobacter xinjiangensis]GGZ60778.1 hypothetical protein GCM10008101_13440 [Lysobacter xinjiangensis]